MKFVIAMLVLALAADACSSDDKVQTRMFPEDQKLIISWKSFKDALNRGDTAALKASSHTCIYSLEADTVISPEKFYREYNIFNSTLLSYINDSAKVSASYDETGFLENYPCFLNNKDMDSAKIASIHISIPIPGEEGLTVLLQFIENKSDYKFFGHFTIP